MRFTISSIRQKYSYLGDYALQGYYPYYLYQNDYYMYPVIIGITITHRLYYSNTL